MKLVCRDRASAYAAAIDKVCKEKGIHTEQVADRWHLLDNLKKHLQDAYYPKIPGLIAFDISDRKNPVRLSEIPKKKATAVSGIPVDLDKWTYDNTPVLDEAGNPITFYPTATKLKDEELAARADKYADLYNNIMEARAAYECAEKKYGLKKALCEKYNITNYKLNKWLTMTDEELDALKASAQPVSKENGFQDYKYIACKMLKAGHSLTDVFWYIRKKTDCILADTTLLKYVIASYSLLYPDSHIPDESDCLEMKLPKNVVVLNRRSIFAALLTIDYDKMDKDVAICLPKICELYPDCQYIMDTFKRFHDILIVAPKIEYRTDAARRQALKHLDLFLEDINGTPLQSFHDSVTHDKKCIQNAIMHSESSGPIEGRNLRVKLWMRISGGKLKHETLEIKLKLAFMFPSESFTIEELDPSLGSRLKPRPESNSEVSISMAA